MNRVVALEDGDGQGAIGAPRDDLRMMSYALDSAVCASSWGAQAIAAELAVSVSLLGDWRAGRRQFSVTRPLPWFRQDSAAASAFYNALLCDAGLAQTKPLPRQVSRQSIGEALFARALENTGIRRRVAQDFQVDTDVIDTILGSPDSSPIVIDRTGE